MNKRIKFKNNYYILHRERYIKSFTSEQSLKKFAKKIGLKEFVVIELGNAFGLYEVIYFLSN